MKSYHTVVGDGAKGRCDQDGQLQVVRRLERDPIPASSGTWHCWY
ncbi:MAG: hypothetical protein ACLFUU_10995 [Desulfobacteraceae bacterium]